ncbi:hypothetical protein [Paenibacillus sp. TSA_86.1]
MNKLLILTISFSFHGWNAKKPVQAVPRLPVFLDFIVAILPCVEP